ncbi:hypothetical protein [Pseudactinotalea terrae]|uniref:hypothetical protein n=1 Tax=Pseudactinotalea terrae TaxID=1743262 RepID=UPI0012E0F773|nr:hypothetical protein [Pseudactinotalea terrae]
MAQLGWCEHRDCGDRAWHVTVDESGEPHVWCGRHNIDAVRGGPVRYVPTTLARTGGGVSVTSVLEVATVISAGLLVLAFAVCLGQLLVIQTGIEVDWPVSPVGALGVLTVVTTLCGVTLRALEARRTRAA